MRWFAVLIAVSGLPLTDGYAAELDTIPLTIAGYEIAAEVAHTQLSRSQGLMYRESLGENAGMLFVFPNSGYYSMWMKNTYIPLSVAFIDVRGVILNIAEMQPETLTSHDSAGMAKYALEMNKGWFAARKITAGTQVTGLERAPAAD
ncbi:MAG: DUF192 domain-containing protein [Proteobacteria bacterium]|nr:DUF192 domain-containing protein [Pseudomonadota bacterium]